MPTVKDGNYGQPKGPENPVPPSQRLAEEIEAHEGVRRLRDMLRKERKMRAADRRTFVAAMAACGGGMRARVAELEGALAGTRFARAELEQEVARLRDEIGVCDAHGTLNQVTDTLCGACLDEYLAWKEK